MNRASSTGLASFFRAGLITVLTLSFISSAWAAADENSLTEKERAEGWKLLFDGKSTAGWRGFRKKTMPEGWQVIDGAIVMAKRGGGHIVTDEEFGDFELVFDWKIEEGGNSGVVYRSSEQENSPYDTGLEYQVLDNAKHGDGRNPLTSAAAAYALYAPKRDATLPPGQWNKAKIVAKGNHVEHWLNGEKVLEFEIGSDDWTERVQKSKFGSLPRFGKVPKGHVVLTDHNDRVEYRNIKIRSLAK